MIRDSEGNLPASMVQVLGSYKHLVEEEGIDPDIASVLCLAERVNVLSMHISAGTRRLREVIAKDGKWRAKN